MPEAQGNKQRLPGARAGSSTLEPDIQVFKNIKLTSLTPGATLQVQSDGSLAPSTIYPSTYYKDISFSNVATSGTDTAPIIVTTLTGTLPLSSTGNWRCTVQFTFGPAGLTAAGHLGIGSIAPGTSGIGLFAATVTTHNIIGGSCVSDNVNPNPSAAAVSIPYICTLSSGVIFQFTGLSGSTQAGNLSGFLSLTAVPI